MEAVASWVAKTWFGVENKFGITKAEKASARGKDTSHSEFNLVLSDHTSSSNLWKSGFESQDSSFHKANGSNLNPGRWKFVGLISFPFVGPIMLYLAKRNIKVLIAWWWDWIDWKQVADDGFDVIVLSRNQMKHCLPRGCSLCWIEDSWTKFIDSNTIILNLADENPASGFFGRNNSQKQLDWD